MRGATFRDLNEKLANFYKIKLSRFNQESLSFLLKVEAENTHQRGKYRSAADLLLDWFGFDQSSKTVVHST